MKNKKLLTMISSVAMATVLGATAFAGCKKEEHIYIWDDASTIKATCTTEGKRHGICATCGDYKEEILPIDPDNHDYGDWEVSVYPDGEKSGEAVKKCGYNSAHEIKTTLPRLTDDFEGYASNKIKKPATAIAAGERELVLESEAGKVTFTVEIPKRAVETVEDAVLLGSSLGNLIRSASGHYTESSITDAHKFSYYYGDGYTYIKDEGASNEEYWITRDGDDKVFGIVSDDYNDPHAAENVTDDYMFGFGYSSGANNMRTFGAENTLLKYYERAKLAREQGTAVLYDEGITSQQGGGFKAWFSYGYFENPRFSRYKLDFTIDGTGVLTSLTLSTKIIHQYMIEEDSKGNKLFYENGDVVFAEEYDFNPSTAAPLYEMEGANPKIDGVKTDCNGVELKDSEGNTIPRYQPVTGNMTDASGNTVVDSKGKPVPHYQPATVAERRYYSDDHSNVDKKELVYDNFVLKTAEDVVPECPYSSDDLYITSFDLKTEDGSTVGGEGVTIDANKSAVFEITGIQPETASIEYDPVKVYLRTAARDIELTSNQSDNSYNATGFFSITETGTGANRKKVGNVTLNVRYAGDVTIVLKTKGGKFEKELKLTLQKGAPTEMTSEVYAYNDADGKERHLWTTYDNNSPAIVMYVGETLRMRAIAPDGEAQFVDASFNAKIDATGTDPRVTFTNDVDYNGVIVSEAVPHVAGRYAVYLTFNRAQNIFKYFNVEVRNAPDMSSVIGGSGDGAEYTVRSSYIKLTADNSNPAPADVNVKFNPGEAWSEGTITVTIDGNTATYSYAYDVSAGTLTTEYVSGISGTTLDFTFERNEMYKIVLKHSIGFGTNTETLVLKQA